MQINTLLKAGVPPQNITVVGASKGAGMTILVSDLMKNKDINNGPVNRIEIVSRLKGQVASIKNGGFESRHSSSQIFPPIPLSFAALYLLPFSEDWSLFTGGSPPLFSFVFPFEVNT
jgi:acetyl esterase/lipase